MPIQRTKFHSAIKSPPAQAIRTEIVEPVLGLNVQHPATNLRPGQTPFSQNMVLGDKYIQPRDGLSTFGSAQTATTLLASDVPLYACFAPERIGTDVAYVVSKGTIIQHAPGDSTSSWTLVTGVRPSSNTKNPGSFYDGIYDHTVVYDAASDLQYLILTNWNHPPLKVPVQSSGAAAASYISSFLSMTSNARFTEVMDDRLLFFSSKVSGEVPEQTRVWWSARGTPFEFASGGFEDLIAMRGVPSGMARNGDTIVLYSNREVWIGRTRRDAYAFDFMPLHQDVGNLHPLTLRETPVGPIWLGPDFQFYRIDSNNAIRKVGPHIADLLRVELREPQLAFSVYEPNSGIYEFHYSDTTGQYPTKALFLKLDTIQPVNAFEDYGAWLLQDFNTIELTAGSRVNNNIAPTETQSQFFVSSKATPYQLLSAATNDDGTAIDCRWRSHALRGERDLFPYEKLQELWLEYEYDSTVTSTLSLFQSTDNGASFTAAASASLTSGVGYTMLPVDQPAARNQMFEVRLNDGTKPKLARFQLALRGYSGRFVG